MADKLQHERFLGRRDGVSVSVRVLFRRAGILGLVVLLFFSVMGSWRAYQKAQESSAMRTVAETENTDLVEREQKLKADIERLSTDRGKEEVLRERYGLAKEGEHMVVIVESNPIPVATTSAWKEWVQGILH